MIAKKYLATVLCTFLFGAVASAQDEKATTVSEPETGITADKPVEGEELVSHKVMMGETIMLIAKKYKVKPIDIYQYNPDATQGITAGTFLQVPVHKALGKPKKKTEIAESAPIQPDTYSGSTAQLKTN